MTLSQRLAERGFTFSPEKKANAVYEKHTEQVRRATATLIEYLKDAPPDAVVTALGKVRKSFDTLWDASTEAASAVYEYSKAGGSALLGAARTAKSAAETAYDAAVETHRRIAYVVGGIVDFLEKAWDVVAPIIVVALYLAQAYFAVQDGMGDEYGQTTKDNADSASNAQAYDILGVSPDASDEEIKQAYRERVKESHPDQGGSAEEFKRVKQAKDTLL